MSEQFIFSFDDPDVRRLRVCPPSLPSIIRYVDDYTDEDHTVPDPLAAEWLISNNGSLQRVKFHRYRSDPALQLLIQAFAADLLVRMAASSARNYVDSLVYISLSDIVELVECEPDGARPIWDRLRAKSLNDESHYIFAGLKALLRFSAERKVGAWSPVYLTFISSSLPLPPRDKYKAIRSGDVFITIKDESALIRWIEDRAKVACNLPPDALIDTALVICSYQFAMRPKQIGTLRRRDCRVLSDAGGAKTVHLTFRMLKQRTTTSKQMRLVRRVKREWAPIFSEIFDRFINQEGGSHLFGYNDATSISNRLCTLIGEATKSHWTATDLRHSGAMRLVDAGASAEELAEFMGHSSLETGLVYYDTSATQAERINQALGISETYQHVANIGGSQFISKDDLAKLKGDDQVAGVPHGIPLAGIGACVTGQPACPFNPVTACYGCPRFIPVSDMSIHAEALKGFRDVVHFFYSTSRGESTSPAYLQLKRTISEIQTVINELESLGAE